MIANNAIQRTVNRHLRRAESAGQYSAPSARSEDQREHQTAAADPADEFALAGCLIFSSAVAVQLLGEVPYIR